MIRAFLCSWSGEAGGLVTHPILEWIEATGQTGDIVCSMHYAPTLALNGLPTHPQVLVLVRAADDFKLANGQSVEFFGTLTGVFMFPPNHLLKPSAEVSLKDKGDITTGLTTKAIVIDQTKVAVYGDYLRSTARALNPAFTSFGADETRVGEFA